MQLFTSALVRCNSNSHHMNNDNDQHYSNYYLNKNAMTGENTFFNNMLCI